METALLQNVTGDVSYLTRYLHNGKIPVAVWDFSDDWTSHDWSFSRASAASYFDATGLVELGADLPRMVAASGELALLVEPASGNDCDASNITLIDIASDGTPHDVGWVEMTRLTDGDGAGYLQFNACSIAGLAVGDPVVFSCVLHAGTTSVVDLWVGIGTTGVARTRARFDLGNETATVFGDPDMASPVALLHNLGNGLYRACLTSKIVSEGANEDLCRITGIEGTMDFAFPQFEARSTATSVIVPPSTYRAADVLTLNAPSGSFAAVFIDDAGNATSIELSHPSGDWQPQFEAPQTLRRIALYPS